MKRALLLCLALACGSQAPQHYQCTPGSGTPSSLSGQWSDNKFGYYGEFTLHLYGTPDHLCGSGRLGPPTRETRAGLSGTEKRLRWDAVCTLESYLGWQPPCELNQIVDTTWYDVVQIDGNTIQLNNTGRLYRVPGGQE